MCLSLGSKTLVPAVHGWHTNFNWLFANTNSLLDVNNSKLETHLGISTLEKNGSISASVLHHARKSLFSLITTYISNCGLTMCPPDLLYLADKYLARNVFCLLLTLKKVIHAFISTKLDYCSSLYCGRNRKANSQLQLISKCSSYAPDRPTKQESYLSCVGVLSPAHWKEVTFKYCHFIYEALHGLTAQCISQ